MAASPWAFIWSDLSHLNYIELSNMSISAFCIKVAEKSIIISSNLDCTSSGLNLFHRLFTFIFVKL